MVQNFQCIVTIKALKIEFRPYFAVKDEVAVYGLLNDTQMEFGFIILIMYIFINIEAF